MAPSQAALAPSQCFKSKPNESSEQRASIRPTSAARQLTSASDPLANQCGILNNRVQAISIFNGYLEKEFILFEKEPAIYATGNGDY